MLKLASGAAAPSAAVGRAGMLAAGRQVLGWSDTAGTSRRLSRYPVCADLEPVRAGSQAGKAPALIRLEATRRCSRSTNRWHSRLSDDVRSCRTAGGRPTLPLSARPAGHRSAISDAIERVAGGALLPPRSQRPTWRPATQGGHRTSTPPRTTAAGLCRTSGSSRGLATKVATDAGGAAGPRRATP